MSFWTRLLRGTAGDQYHRGIRLFNEGNYDEAVRVLEDVIAGGDRHANPFAKLGAFYAAEAHAKLGLANFHTGELEKARHHFDVALRENPHYPDLYFYLGVVEHHGGNHSAAIEHLRRAIELNPEYAEATCLLGMALHDAGFFDAATGTFARALELVRRTPHPLSRVLIEKLEARAFDLPPLAELREVVSDGGAYSTLVRDATNAFNAGDYERSIAGFRAALDLHPRYADLHAKLGMAHLEHGESEAAV